MTPKRLTVEQVETLLNLYHEGASWRSICRTIGITQNSLAFRLKIHANDPRVTNAKRGQEDSLTSKEVALALGISQAKVKRLTKEGVIPYAHKVARVKGSFEYRFDREVISGFKLPEKVKS